VVKNVAKMCKNMQKYGKNVAKIMWKKCGKNNVEKMWQKCGKNGGHPNF
jgi:hypothetical protein